MSETAPPAVQQSLPMTPPTAVPASPTPVTFAEAIPSTTQNVKEQYLGLKALAFMVAALFLVVIMITLDASILATAIPKITDHFHTLTDIGWYAAAYMLTNAALQPLTGKAYTYFSLKYTFLLFVALFELGSMICALAQSSSMLVVGRAVSGMGASGLQNGAITIIGVAAPPSQRPMLMGLLMSMAGIGQLAGPLIGGALTQHASWRWCFWINLPVGALTLAVMLVIRFPPYRARKANWTVRDVIHDFDITGFAIFAPACIMLLLALEWGGSTYAWSSATIIGLLCGSVAMFSIFFVWEYFHDDAAMIPPSLVRRRVIGSSMLTSCFQFGGLIMCSYYLPLWFQTIKSASPTMSGVYTLPTFGMQILGAIVAGIVVSRLGYPMPFAMAGSALSAISAGLMSTFAVDTGTGKWVGYQIINGVGRGLSIQQPIQAVQAVVTLDMIPTATAATVWAQTFGGAIFVGLAETAFLNLLQSSLKSHAPGINADEVISAGATNFLASISGSTDAETRRHVLEAYNEAIAHTFYLAAGCAAAGCVASMGIGWTRLERDKKYTKTDTEKGKSESNAKGSSENDMGDLRRR